MDPFYRHDNILLYSGDLRTVLPQTLPSNTVDFVVTDPPYGLSFMERDWDFEVPGPEYWRAIGRVCKPGALLLAFGGTRTYHRLTCAIEDAGWEIRDCLMWLHGQGFPKAADVGKMIDKAKGAEREVVGDKLDRPGYHLHEGKGNGCYGGGNGLHAPGTDARLRAAQITAPATSEAAKWTGWANALKPAWEPIVLAMKPMDGTIAHNALTHGVAGMNIDATRIGCDGPSPAANRRASARLSGNAPMQDRTLGVDSAAKANEMGKIGRRGSAEVYKAERPSETLGRWPANLLLDEEAAQLLDVQTGTLKSGTGVVRTKAGDGYHGGMGKAGDAQVAYGDSGGASRFFYCGKATKKERGLGNDHPTVKPVKLMEYLLTLLSTPDGGVILDPFAGSGTTLVAARKLGRTCIGVELSGHNCAIARERISEL